MKMQLDFINPVRWPALLAVVAAHSALIWLGLGSADMDARRPRIEAPVLSEALSAVLLSRPAPAVPVRVHQPRQATARLQPQQPMRSFEHRPTPAPSAPAASEPAPTMASRLVTETSATVADPAPSPEAAAVVLPRADAQGLQNHAPAYPQTSSRLGEEGRVTLLLLIAADGSVADIKLERSSGFMRLDRAAIGAVKRWRFIPARQGGQAIAYWYSQVVTFSLKSSFTTE